MRATLTRRASPLPHDSVLQCWHAMLLHLAAAPHPARPACLLLLLQGGSSAIPGLLHMTLVGAWVQWQITWHAVACSA